MAPKFSKRLAFLATLLAPQLALATSSAELYTATAYGYGRVEARVRFAAGDGVVSSFFLWKEGSEQAGAFWNELDFEKLGAECRLETNPIYGKPSANHSQKHALELDLCGVFHTYAYEWTPEAIAWFVDGVEIRRDKGATPQAFAENASAGMQIHFNLWPGDATFGGNFDPAILPVHEYVDWVQFSKYEGGAFALAWREDFDQGALPPGWLTGTWASPKNRSNHSAENVNFIDGYAVLSLTADDALGPAGAMPEGGGGPKGAAGSAAGVSGATGAGGLVNAAGASSSAGAGPSQGGSPNGSASMDVATPGAAPRAGGCSLGPSRQPVGALAALGAAALALLQRWRRARG